MVRLPQLDDAEDLEALERAVLEDGRGVVLGAEQLADADEQRRRIERLLEMSAAGAVSTMRVAEHAGRIAGVARLSQLGPELCRHVGILSVEVHPDHQRKGIGRALMSSLIEHAAAAGLARLELYVRSDNTRAQALYASLGFHHEGTRARFVRLPSGQMIDDWILARFLR